MAIPCPITGASGRPVRTRHPVRYSITILHDIWHTWGSVGAARSRASRASCALRARSPKSHPGRWNRVFMVTDVSILAAFIAGVFSISSPCVLPLIPIYLTHIAGVSVGERESAQRSIVLRNAGAYVAGFSIVFILLGVATGAVGTFATSLDFFAQNKLWIVRIGGLLLVVFGLHQLGIFRIPFLYRDAHMQVDGGKPGTVGSSFIIGLTFGAGWSPCMGPLLAAILTMAAGQGSIERATLLLTVYSLGLAVPFMGAALAFSSLPNILRRVNKHLHRVTSVSGAVMIGVGVIMVLGIYENLFTEIIRNAPWQPFEPEL